MAARCCCCARAQVATLNDIVHHWLNWVIPPSEKALIAKLPNKNRPSHFLWLQSLLNDISNRRPPDAPPDGGKPSARSGTPVFVVAGACPSNFAGMQAVVYVAVEERGSNPKPPVVDFWWVKPRAAHPSRLEAATLPRNKEGAHKNTPGASAAVYAPLAKLFSEPPAAQDMRFSLEKCAVPPEVTSGRETSRSAAREGAQGGATAASGWRACVRSTSDPSVGGYLCLVWQEAWSSPLAYRKWIQGKLLYQKDPAVRRFHACPYRIDGKAVSVNLALEKEVISVLPPDSFKLDCDGC